MTVRAVICDLGGVVINIDPDRIRRHWARRSSRPEADVHAAFPDEAYFAFERDELTEAQYLDHVRRQLDVEGTDDELADDFSQLLLEPDHGTVQVLQELRDHGWKVLALTNTNRIHERFWSHRYAAELQVFHAIHCSHDLQARKPQPGTFLAVLEQHGLDPAEAVFIDDLAVNVEAARDLGLHGLLFTSAERLRRQLRDIPGASLPW